MKTSFINNILNSQPILTKFALKLFVCKCLSFQTHLLLELRFPLKLLFLLQKDIIQPVRNALDYYTTVSITERYHTASKKCVGLLHSDAKSYGGGFKEEERLIKRAAKTEWTHKQC